MQHLYDDEPDGNCEKRDENQHGLQNPQGGGSREALTDFQGLRRLYDAGADGGGKLAPDVSGVIGKFRKARCFGDGERDVGMPVDIEAVYRSVVNLQGDLLLGGLADERDGIHVQTAAFREFQRRMLQLRVKERRKLHAGGVVRRNGSDDACQDKRRHEKEHQFGADAEHDGAD